MPNPTAGDVHVNALLTNISVAFIQSEADFVAAQVFPAIPVQKQSDYYMSYDREDWMRLKAKKRAPGTESVGGGFRIKTDNTYFCDVWAYHQDVDDQTRANADAPLNMDRDATLNVTRQMLLTRENDWAAAFLTTGLWTGSSTGTDIVPSTKWDVSTATPIDDIDAEKDAIMSKTGIRPNMLVLTQDVYTVLKNHPTILDRIKYTQRGVITADLMAGMLDVQKLVVVRAVIDDSDEGATASPGFLATDRALLCYSEPNPGIMKPSAGYTFMWNGLLGASAGARIKRFRLEQLESDRIEVEAAWDHVLVAADLGAYFTTVLT